MAILIITQNGLCLIPLALIVLVSWQQVQAYRRGGGGLFSPVHGPGWSNDHYGMSSSRWVGSREYLNHEKE